MDTVYSLEVWVPDGEQWRWSAIGAYPTLDMAVAVGEGFLSVKPYRVRRVTDVGDGFHDFLAEDHGRMVRIMKKSGNRLEGIGERIDVRLTLLEEALGMTPGDPEIYGNWIASKAPEPEVGEEEVGVIEGMDAVEDATTCFPRTEDGVPFCWDYQIKGFFKDACSALRRVPGTRSSKLTAFKKVIDGTVFVEQRRIPFQLPEGAECGRPRLAAWPTYADTALRVRPAKLRNREVAIRNEMERKSNTGR